MPDYLFEQAISGNQVALVAGVDEAGRGPLAGPVVAAAVILPKAVDIPGLDDSKRLTPQRREKMAEVVKRVALAWAWAAVEVAYIDQHGILQATQEAMRRAVSALGVRPGYLLVDGSVLPGVPIPQWGVVRGDALCFSIAAASVLAKVQRDHLMQELDGLYPGYGLAVHKGYSTRLHWQAIRTLGPSPCHRVSFLGGMQSRCSS